MPQLPKTSVSLIMAISSDPGSRRWKEMYDRYREPLRSFLQARFPSLGNDADDLIQETMAALARQLPNWRYSPDEKGSFHCYLAGILKYKAMDALRRRERDSRIKKGLENAAEPPGGDEREDDEWLASAMELAIGEVLSDESVNSVHRNVFRRIALQNESPEKVAKELGVTRANVDVIKSRLIARAAKIAQRLCLERP